MKTKKLLSALGVAVGLAFASAPASAITFFSPITAFQDDDLEFVVDTDSSGTLTVGDRFITAGEMRNTQPGLTGGPATIGPEELTFVSDVTIVALGPTPGSFVLGPSGAAGVLSGFALGTTLAAFTDATPDFEPINSFSCATRALCLTQAGLGLTDGSALFATFGFFGDADEAWLAVIDSTFFALFGASIGPVQGATSSTKVATVNFLQTLGINATGANLVPRLIPGCVVGVTDCMIDAIGSADVLGGVGLTASEWTARSDADFEVAVPEPGSLALLGVALAGLGLLRRRKFRS